MQASLLKRLRCPQCQQAMVLEGFEQEASSGAQATSISRDVVNTDEAAPITKEGVLLCAACKAWYPIYQYVPILLIFVTPLHEQFRQRYAARLDALADYSPPRGMPERGEQSTQETFTDEWDTVQDDEFSFTYSLEELRQLHQSVWLQHALEAPEKVTSILNVGIGLALETIAVQDIFGGVETVGVDLNLALLKSARLYKSRPNFHLVVASLFHLPFATRSFDLVYSQGVLHHTYSTQKAVRSVARFVRQNGYLVVWVYGLDHLHVGGMYGIAMNIKEGAERIVRPAVSRLPRPLRDAYFRVTSVVLHPFVKLRTRHKSWSRRNTEHYLRDRLSPRYAYQHEYNEVTEWFENLNFKVVGFQSPAAYRRLFNMNLYGVGVTGRLIDADRH